MKTAHEQPKECDKELKASIWPQIAPDQNLMSYTGRAVGMRVFTLSEMVFGWVLRVRERPRERQHTGVSHKSVALQPRSAPLASAVGGFHVLADLTLDVPLTREIELPLTRQLLFVLGTRDNKE